MTDTRNATTRASWRAFTITELLVVIGIITLLIAVAVPAFSNLLASSERALAENQLKAGLAAGRDAAIQSEAGDGAAVFFFTPGGRLTIVPCVAVAQIVDSADLTNGAASPTVLRDIFVPVSTIASQQLPRGWGVRGYAPAGSVYAVAGTAPNSEPWYESYFDGTLGDGVAGWVFPETGMYDNTPGEVNNAARPSGTRRQSFMVRFKAGSGEVDLSNNGTALVFDPAPTTVFRMGAPFNNFRADQLRIGTTVAPNPATFVRRLVNHPLLTTNVVDLRRLLGDRSPDTVLVRPVSELALYEESHLGAGIGAPQLNRATGTIYGDPSGRKVPTFPRIDTDLMGGPVTISNHRDLATQISGWISGRPDSSLSQAIRESRPYDARVYTMTRYLGRTEEVEP